MRALRIALALLLLALMVGIVSATQPAFTLQQYIEILTQLRQAVKSGHDSGSTLSAAQKLPPEWHVEADGCLFTISSNGIGQALNSYAKQRTPSNLAAITSQIDLMLSDARGMQAAKSDVTAEHNKLTEILSRREFRNVKGESWYERLKDAVQRWLAHLLNRILFSSAFPVVSRIVIWILVALAVIVALLWVIRNYRQSNIYTNITGVPETLTAKPWRDWQAEAQLAAREGRWRDAVHLSYWAAISFLESQGLWRPDRARTPREYLRLLAAGDAHRDPLQQLTRDFEKVWYGTDAATAESFAGASALLERLGCR